MTIALHTKALIFNNTLKGLSQPSLPLAIINKVQKIQ